MKSFVFIVILFMFSLKIYSAEYKIDKIFEGKNINNSYPIQFAYDYQRDIVYLLSSELVNNYSYNYHISKFENNTWTTINDIAFPQSKTIDLYQLKLDKNGDVWLSGKNGILNYSNSKWNKIEETAFPKYSQKIYNSIFTDSIGNAYFFVCYGEPSQGFLNILATKIFKINQDKSIKEIFYAEYGVFDNFMSVTATIGARSMITDKNGIVWLASSQVIDSDIKQEGLIRFDPSKEEFTFVKMKNYTKESLTCVIYPQKLINDEKTGKIWVNYTGDIKNKTRGGAGTYDPQTKSWEHLNDFEIQKMAPFNRIEDMLIDDNNEIWFGTRQWGIIKLASNNKDFKEISLQNELKSTDFNWDIIKDSFKDKHGNLWFATSAGLLKYSKSTTDISFDNANQNFKIYPNLIKESEKINFVIDESSNDNHILIYDNLGNFVEDISCIEDRTIAFDTSKLSSGKYFAKYANMIQAFIIEK